MSKQSEEVAKLIDSELEIHPPLSKGRLAKIAGIIEPYLKGEWQPIESAPKCKDGGSILVFCPDFGVQLVAWLDNATGVGPSIMEWCEPGSWQDEQGGYTTADNPTHWQPLPDPPKETT